MISFWQHHRVEGTAAGGVIFPGRYGLARDLRIAGEPGISILPLTTNLLLNPSFEVNVTDDWTADAGMTAAQSADRSANGVYSAKLSSSGAKDFYANGSAISASTRYYCGCWVYVIQGTATVYGADLVVGWVSQVNQVVSTAGQWVWVGLTFVSRGSSTQGRLGVTVSDGGICYIDGCYFATKPTFGFDASVDNDGAQGVGGIAWNSTAHNSTSVIATGGSLYWPTAKMGNLSILSNTVTVYWRPSLSNAMPADAYIWHGGTVRILYFRASDDKFVLDVGDGVVKISTAQTFSAGDLLAITITLNFTSSTWGIYINGVLSTSGTYSPGGAWATNFYLGSDAGSPPANQCSGVLAHLSIYNEAKSAADVLAMYNQGPGPFTGCVFYAPLTDSIHGEAGTCIGLDRLSTGPYLRFGNWRPTVPVQTALGIESFERDGVELEVQKYGNVTESMLLHFQNLASPDTGLKDVKRLGSIMHTARMWSESNARGQPGTEAVDLIYRPTGIGRLGRSRVLGWGNSAMTPEQLEYLVSKGRGDVTLSFVREPFWRCAERALGNGATTVYTQDDNTHDNFTAIVGDPSWIEGEIPAPATLWLKNTTANTYNRVVAALIQDRRGDNVTPVPWLEAESEVAYYNSTAEAGGGADATASGGTRVEISPTITDYSLQFDGYDSYCTTADAATWALGTAAGDFTIEFFIYLTDYASTTLDTQRILDHSDYSAPNYRGWMLSASPIVGFHMNFYTGSTTDTISAGISQTVPSLNAWHHVAVCYSRNSSNIVVRRWFIDGKKSSDITLNQGTSVAADSAGAFTIGSSTAPNQSFFKIDELRISNNIRYTDDFTVPTAAFVNDANTVGLWHFNEGTGTTAADDVSVVAHTAHDFTLTNFSVTATDNWLPGIFSVLVTESRMGDWLVPLTMAEQYAGQMVAWCRMKVPSGGAVASVTVRGRWVATNVGSFWSVDNKRPGTANQWEWVELGTIQVPWFPVRDNWVEAAVMDTTTNRQFSIYTTGITTADDVHLDAFIFLPKTGFYANVAGCNLTGNGNKGLLFDWTGRKPMVSKTGSALYTPEFEPQLDPVATALQVWPGRQAWLHILISRASELNTLSDSVDVYPLRYRPLYLELPVDE